MAKLIQGINDLETVNPELAKEWDYKKNGDLKPTAVTSGSIKKVWWICDKGHSFESTISNRNLHQRGCPYCAGQKVLPGFNDLFSLNPELAQKWDYAKNNPLKPTDITCGSRKEVWWICDKGHSFKMRVSHRTSGHNCPYCSGHKVMPGFNDLATTNPELLSEWDYKKNLAITPQSVSAGSEKQIWWICNNGHSYKTTLHKRTGKKKFGCPYCSNHKVLVGYNDLATTHPHLLSEWDYKKNDPIKPEMLTAGMEKQIAWICPKGHSYTTRLPNRTNNSNLTGCPYCANKKVWVGYNDLESTYPELAKEFDSIKNGTPPDKITYGNHKYFWWKCKYGHEWKTTLHNRINSGTNCPICKNKSTLNKCLHDFCSSQNVDFIPEYKFSDCRNALPLPFDIYLPDLNILIEGDGIQHFKPITYFGGKSAFEYVVNNDSIKNQYCRNKGIPLLRIPYIYNAVKDKDKIGKFISYFIQAKEIPNEIKQFYEKFPFSNYIT